VQVVQARAGPAPRREKGFFQGHAVFPAGRGSYVHMTHLCSPRGADLTYTGHSIRNMNFETGSSAGTCPPGRQQAVGLRDSLGAQVATGSRDLRHAQRHPFRPCRPALELTR
jgi:hypothetical protein